MGYPSKRLDFHGVRMANSKFRTPPSKLLSDLLLIEIIVNGFPITATGDQAAAILHIKCILVVPFVLYLPNELGVDQQGSVYSEEKFIIELFLNRLEGTADEVGLFGGVYLQIVPIGFNIADIKSFDQDRSPFFLHFQAL